MAVLPGMEIFPYIVPLNHGYPAIGGTGQSPIKSCPFDGAKPHLLRRGSKAPLGVNSCLPAGRLSPRLELGPKGNPGL